MGRRIVSIQERRQKKGEAVGANGEQRKVIKLNMERETGTKRSNL